MSLPETTKLLQRYKVDWAEFHCESLIDTQGTVAGSVWCVIGGWG